VLRHARGWRFALLFPDPDALAQHPGIDVEQRLPWSRAGCATRWSWGAFAEAREPRREQHRRRRHEMQPRDQAQRGRQPLRHACVVARSPGWTGGGPYQVRSQASQRLFASPNTAS
jgi:hypothetical protein